MIIWVLLTTICVFSNKQRTEIDLTGQEETEANKSRRLHGKHFDFNEKTIVSVYMLPFNRRIGLWLGWYRCFWYFIKIMVLKTNFFLHFFFFLPISINGHRMQMLRHMAWAWCSVIMVWNKIYKKIWIQGFLHEILGNIFEIKYQLSPLSGVIKNCVLHESCLRNIWNKPIRFIAVIKIAQIDVRPCDKYLNQSVGVLI